MLKRIITAAAFVAITTPVEAAGTCHPGYHCIDLYGTAVGSPQDAQEDRERVRRAEQRVEAFRALKRSYEARTEDPNVAWAREENARQAVEAERSSALRRERINRLDSEWNAYLATEAARRSPSPQSITVIDSRGNAFFGTVQPY